MRVACFLVGLLWAVLAGAEVLYRLPWPEGLSFMFTQVPGGRITSHFAKSTLHAVDIAMPAGVDVLCARSGVVEAVEAGQGPDEEPATYEGNFVRVRHDDGTAAIYAHLEYRSVAVTPGETVRAGQPIARSGASGDAVRPHLHFAVTRLERNSSGWPEEVSLPVKFYVGVPAIAFAPRAAVTVKANYSSAAEYPRTPLEAATYDAAKRPAAPLDDEGGAWLRLAAWLAVCIAGLAWFWRFSRK